MKLFDDVKFEITFERKFDGERFTVVFSSPGLGTCMSVQTDEQVALDGALSLLKQRLGEEIARRMQGKGGA